MQQEFKVTRMSVGLTTQGVADVPMPEGDGWWLVSTVATNGFVVWTWAREVNQKQTPLPSPPDGVDVNNWY
jgi:hypothetical protein